MDDFLSRVPKPILVVVCISLCILFIIIHDPPRTLCTTQLEAFKEEVGTYLFIDPLKQSQAKDELKSGFQKDRDYCQNINSAGGCYEFFFNLKNMLRNLDAVSSECQSSMGKLKEVKQALWETLDLMVRIAWGGTPPQGIYDKYSWMDTSDISLFCQVKRFYQSLYPPKAWKDLQENTLKSLPGTESLSPERIWEFSILSDNCTQF